MEGTKGAGCLESATNSTTLFEPLPFPRRLVSVNHLLFLLGIHILCTPVQSTTPSHHSKQIPSGLERPAYEALVHRTRQIAPILEIAIYGGRVTTRRKDATPQWTPIRTDV